MSTDASKPRLSVTGSPEDYKPTYGDPKVSTSNDVAFQKEPRFGAPMGILSTQTEKHGAKFPGRDVPKAEAVKDATCAPAGTAKVQTDKQLKEQRQDLK